MLIIKVKGQNAARVLDNSTHIVNYVVNEQRDGVYCKLLIDDQEIFESFIDEKIQEVREKMESLSDSICELLCVSTMETNESVFRITIEPGTQLGETTTLSNYGSLSENH